MDNVACRLFTTHGSIFHTSESHIGDKKGTDRRTRFSLRISFYNLVLEARDYLVLAW